MRDFCFTIVALLMVGYFSPTQAQHRLPAIESHVLINSDSLSGELDNSDLFGGAACPIGDVDGDGNVDIAIGARKDDDGGTDRGAVYILFMSKIGTINSYQKISDTQGSFGGTLANQGDFGIAAAPIGDYDGNGVPDLAIGNAYDNDGGTQRGSVWILCLNSDGTVLNEHKISDTQGNFTAILDNADYFGRSVASPGDLDGDGVNDLVVGAQSDDDGATNAGAVYVLFLNAYDSIGSTGLVTGYQKISNSEGGLTATIDASDHFGVSVVGLGDVDGNGVGDIAVGAFRDDDGGTNRGAAYVLLLNSPSNDSINIASEVKISDRITDKIDVLEDDWQFSSGMGPAGDADLDGIPDLIIGAYNAGSSSRGTAFLVSLNADGTAKDFRRIGYGYSWTHTAIGSFEQFGISLSAIGDLNNDGVMDFVIGAQKDDDGGLDRGAAYVLFGDDNPLDAFQGGYPILSKWIKAGEDGFNATLDNTDKFGSSVTLVGDINDDGVDDIAIGATGDDDGGTDRGAVYILFMGDDGIVDSFQKISDTQGGLAATLNDNDEFGHALAQAGDLNEDGIPDLLVGVPNDDDGGADKGAIYVLYLNSDGTVGGEQKISATTGGFTATIDNADEFGWSITSPGDLNNDSYPDIIVGASGDDDDGTNAGALYVLFLAPTDTVDSYHKINETSGDLGSTILSASSEFGKAITVLGDLDNDTVPDIAVHIRESSKVGGVVVLLMNTDGSVSAHQKIGSTQMNGELDNLDYFGIGIAATGDMDNDTVPDLIVTALGDDDGETAAGAVYSLFLNSDGTLKGYEKHSRTVGHLTSSQNSTDSYGFSAAWLGDIDSDGLGDLAIGARLATSTSEGIVYRYNVQYIIKGNSEVYAQMSKTLTSGFVPIQNCELKFAFKEEYTEIDGNLTYNVYDEDRNVVLSNSSNQITVSQGYNLVSISSSSLADGYYVLEVIDQKNEKWYLRFEQLSSSCP